MSSIETPERCTAARIAIAPSSGALSALRPPRNLPIGVRAAATMTGCRELMDESYPRRLRTRRQQQRPAPFLLEHAADELGERDRVRLLLLPRPAHVHRHRLRFRRAPADDEHVRHLHARALGDAVLERLRPRVE